MSALYDQLATLRTRMAAVPGVATSLIGLEPTINPDDYPIVRIVPSRVRADGLKRVADVLVYFGAPVHEADNGVEAVYDALLEMETDVIAALSGNGFQCKYVETITDEDRLEHFKLMVVRAEMAIQAVC
jgi:hypothetical protein